MCTGFWVCDLATVRIGSNNHADKNHDMADIKNCRAKEDDSLTRVGAPPAKPVDVGALVTCILIRIQALKSEV